MINDDVITRLVELHDHIQPPAASARLDLLRGERLVRRRHIMSVAAATAVVMLTVAVAQASLSDDKLAQLPADQPTSGPTAFPSTQPDWSLAQIRAEGSPKNERVIEPGITTRAYVVCDGPRAECENDPPGRVPYQHAALEVAEDGRSALFDLGANVQYSAQAFDGGSVFVMDAARSEDWGSPLQLRYRVLRVDGSELLLHLVDDPAPAVAGPGVFVIDFDPVVGGLGDGYAAEAAYLVDVRAGTLRPLDVPHLGDPGGVEARYWGPNVNEFLWFVDPDCKVRWATKGAIEERQLDCAESRDRPTYIYDAGFPEGWLQPGRMAVLEPNPGGLFLHVSLDFGRTWQRLPVSGEAAVPQALARP